MTIEPLALAVMIVGLVLFLIPTTNGKITRIGEMMFFVGLLTVVLNAPGRSFHLP